MHGDDSYQLFIKCRYYEVCFFFESSIPQFRKGFVFLVRSLFFCMI